MTGCALDAFDALPLVLLRYLGDLLDLGAPDLASLRVLYRRRATMFEHQGYAAEVLGFQQFTSGRQRALQRQLRGKAEQRSR